MDEFVADETNRSACEARERWDRHRSIAPQDLLNHLQPIPDCRFRYSSFGGDRIALHNFTILNDVHLIPDLANDRAGVAAYK